MLAVTHTNQSDEIRSAFAPMCPQLSHSFSVCCLVAPCYMLFQLCLVSSGELTRYLPSLLSYTHQALEEWLLIFTSLIFSIANGFAESHHECMDRNVV